MLYVDDVDTFLKLTTYNLPANARPAPGRQAYNLQPTTYNPQPTSSLSPTS